MLQLTIWLVLCVVLLGEVLVPGALHACSSWHPSAWPIGVLSQCLPLSCCGMVPDHWQYMLNVVLIELLLFVPFFDILSMVPIDRVVVRMSAQVHVTEESFVLSRSCA